MTTCAALILMFAIRSPAHLQDRLDGKPGRQSEDLARTRTRRPLRAGARSSGAARALGETERSASSY